MAPGGGHQQGVEFFQKCRALVWIRLIQQFPGLFPGKAQPLERLPDRLPTTPLLALGLEPGLQPFQRPARRWRCGPLLRWGRRLLKGVANNLIDAVIEGRGKKGERPPVCWYTKIAGPAVL